MKISNKQSNIQIIKYILSNVLSTLSGNMFSYALGLMLLSQTGSAISFALGLIINPIVNLIFFIPIGNIVDRIPHKKILLITALVRITAILILIITVDKFNNIYKLIPIIPFLIIISLCNNTSTTTYTASVHELVNNEKIQSLSSLTSAVSALSTIIAPIIGFNFYALFGFKLFIIFEFIISIFILLIIMSINFYYDKYISINNDKGEKLFKKFKIGLHYISKRKLIATLIILGTFLNFIFSSTAVGIPFIMKSNFHVSDSMLGYIETSSACGMLLGSILFNFLPKNKYFKFNIIFPVLSIGLLISIMGAILEFSTKLIIILASICLIEFFVGLLLSMLEISSQVKLQSTTPTNLLGRVSSILITMNNIVFPVGTTIFTILFNHIQNSGFIYIIVGLLCTVYGLITLPVLIKNIDNDDININIQNL